MEIMTRYASLPARPPTPPREANSDRAFKTSEHLSFLPRQSLNTPNDSPSSSAEYSARSSDKPFKRVGFCISPSTIENHPMLGSKENAVWAKSKLPPKECKPIKSILKQSNALFSSDPPDTESPVRDTRDFPRILEDLVRGLASPSISSRLDAYVTLNGCLKAYKDVPAPKALEDKVSLLAEFIRRDLTETKNVDPKVKDEDSARKTQLATEAVRLLTALVFSPTILDALPDSFQTFILNQTITVISSKDMPKGLVNQYMYLLTVQNFRTKSMNNERAGRILTVLNDIDQSVKGRQVLAHRLSVYRKLVTQAKVLMISRCRDWMHHLIGGMFSSAKEIRIRAIALGYEAGQALGSIEQVSKAMREVFDQEPTEEQSPKKYADVLIDRLTAWVKSEESIFVPQIWSVVVLFFKGKPQRLERWAHLSPWLKVIQLCFNSSDPQLKNYANRAWNKLIYIVSPNGATSAMLSALLQKPIRSQLSRHQATDIDGNQKRQYRAYTTYCTLLYFAFRPGTDYNTVDRYWQEYVKQMLAVQPRNPLVDPKSTCRILVSLFGESRLKVWNEDRANDATPIKPDDLPRLDAKWVRLRASSVLATLEVFLSSGSSETWWNTENCDPLALRIWNSFTKAVGEAGSKEIKVTMETMTALAEIIGTIKRLYIKSITAAGFGDKSTTLRRFSQLVEIAVTNLGSRAFCEKRLLQSSKTSFQAAETPSSSRSAKVEGVLASPVLHLLNLLTSTVDDLQTGVAYREAVGSLLGVALQSTTSRRSKLVVLRDVSQYALSENPQSNARIILWEILAQSVMDCIEIGSTDKIVNDSSQQLAQDFTEVIKILEVGAQQGGLQATATWARILESNNLQVHKEAGPAGSIVAVIEPLSRFLCSRMAPLLTSDIVELSAIVLENAVWIDDRKDLDRAKRVLWGIAPLPSKTAVFNPFDYLYSLITDLLTGIYSNLSNIEPSSAARALSSLGAFVASAPISLVVQCLKALQLGIAIWVQDLDKVISTVDGDARIVFRSITKLWNTIAEKIKQQQTFDSHLLSELEDLLLAGFKSRHRAILNISLSLWNSTFAQTDSLKYSKTLVATLIYLDSIANVDISNMSKKSRKLETDVEPIEFADTPACLGDLDDMEMQQRTPKADLVRAEIQSTQQSGRMRSLTPARTPQRSLGTAIQKSKPRLTPRLRHDDSQIQFAPIVSSSPPNLEMLESQLLTDRQKEVRERQNEAASAMFPNLRSSPRAKSQEKTAIYPRLQLEVSHILADHSDLDDLASPTLPPQREMKEFLGSSPTPSQRRSSSRDKARDSQVRNRQSTPTDVPVSAAYDDPPSSPPIATTGLVNTIGSSEEIQQAGTSDIETMNLDILVDVRSLKPETHRLANDNILSDDDVFVDAPLSQDQGEAPQDDANDVSMEDAAQSNNVIDQISSSDPIDKVSAQISFDMERAASQVSEQAAKGSESDASDNSQRQVGNSTPSQPASHVKRSRGRPRKGSTQADPPKEYTVVEDEYMLDCIIVADPGVGASSPHSSPGDTRQPRKRQIDEVETATIPSTAELPPPKKIARLDRVVGGYVNGHDVPARTPATRRSSRLSREPTEPLEGMHEQTGEDVVREEVVERVPSPCFVTAGGDEEPETNGPSSPVHFEREEVQIEPITDGTSISKGEEDEGIMNLELSWESISGPLRAMLDTARKMNAENTTLTGNSREAMSMFFDLGKELNELASWTRG